MDCLAWALDLLVEVEAVPTGPREREAEELLAPLLAPFLVVEEGAGVVVDEGVG